MPVVGKTAEDILARGTYFERTLTEFCKVPSFNDVGLYFHPQAPMVLSQAYFALMEAYKRCRLQQERLSLPTKIAALTCAAVACVNPLRPETEDPIEQEEVLYANPMFAMRLACSIIEHPFHTRAFDDQRRFYQAITNFSLPCLDPLLDEAAALDGQLTSNWELTLTREERNLLDHLVNQMVVLQQLKIFALPDHAAQPAVV